MSSFASQAVMKANQGLLEKEETNPNPPTSPRREVNLGDRILRLVLTILSSLVVLVLLGILFNVIKGAMPAIEQFGWRFIVSKSWNPVEDIYGGLPFIYGTLITSFIALLIAGPLSISVALFITEICPRRLRSVIVFFVEILAAIPSIVYGMWALFMLAPFIRDTFAPVIQEYAGDFVLFSGASFGNGILTASIVLAIMIIPSICSVSTEVFKTVPDLQKEGALALGATRLEMINLAVLKPSMRGIVAATILGLGRALGETMAVAMVIGNNQKINFSLFSSSSTMASIIANEYAEATGILHQASLTYVALLLFGVSFIINFVAKTAVTKFGAAGSGA